MNRSSVPSTNRSARRQRVSRDASARQGWTVGLLVVALTVAVIVALAVGQVLILPSRILIGELSSSETYVLQTMRAPRIVAAVVGGFAFGAAGAVFQGLSRNPLGSPDILGMVAGAGTGALIAITLLNANTLVVSIFALAGSTLAAVVVVSVGGRRGISAMVLVGVGLSSLLYSINSWLALRAAPEVAYMAGRWMTGSIEFASLRHSLVAFAILVGLMLSIGPAVGRWLPMWGLDERQGISMGVDTWRMTPWIIGLGISLVAVAVSLTGPVSLLSLTAPQIAKRLAGSHTPPLFASGLLGAISLVAADIVVRGVIGEGTTTVGAVVLVVGGGFLLWLVGSNGASWRSV